MKLSKAMIKLFEGKSIWIKYNPTEKHNNFENILDLYSFLTNEFREWKAVDIPCHFVEKMRDEYRAMIEDIENLNKSISRQDEEELNSNTDVLLGNIKNRTLLLRNSSLAAYLFNIAKSNYGLADITFSYVFSGESILTSKSSFERAAILGAYYSIFNETIVSEDLSHEDIISEIKIALQEVKDDVKNYRIDFTELSDGIKSNCNDAIQANNGKYKEQYDEIAGKLNSLLGNYKLDFETLETTYESKLALSAPSKYWDKLSRKYKIMGIRWVIASVVNVAVIIGSLLGLFYFFPEMANEITGKETIYKTIKWFLLTAIGISAEIYLLRLFVRLAFSSYHMSRDAEERRVLSFFYLALLKSNAINEKDKGIVLNALFSRVETGLLPGDSAPSIPSGSLSEIAKLLSK
jgi:hypothetical protein